MHLTFKVKYTILHGIESIVHFTFLTHQPSNRQGGVIKMQTRIQELRKERRITQSELADAVNVTRQTIISLENGKYNASLVLAHKLAQYFNVTIEEIFIFDLEEENL